MAGCRRGAALREKRLTQAPRLRRRAAPAASLCQGRLLLCLGQLDGARDGIAVVPGQPIGRIRSSAFVAEQLSKVVERILFAKYRRDLAALARKVHDLIDAASTCARQAVGGEYVVTGREMARVEPIIHEGRRLEVGGSRLEQRAEVLACGLAARVEEYDGQVTLRGATRCPH